MKDWIIFDTLSIRTLLGMTIIFWLAMLVLINLRGREHKWLKRFLIILLFFNWLSVMIFPTLLGDKIFATLLLLTTIIFAKRRATV